MATTQNTYTGNGSTTNYSITFEYLEESDVKVSLDGVDQATSEYSFANATTISFNTAPSNNVAIRIYRVTDTDTARTTFFAGSAIRAQDLNDNNNQLLYATQETINRRVDKTGGTMTGDLVLNDADLVFEGATEDAFETTLTVVDPTADRTITLPNVTGTVVTTGDTGTVATAMIAGDAVNGSKIADDSIDSEHYVDGSIDTAHIADAQVTTAKLAADAVTNAKIADDSIDSEHYVDGSIDTAHIGNLQVTTAKLAADAVTNAKIADDSIDSEHYVDGSIDTAHIADLQVTTAKLAADSVTNAKIADDSIDSEHYVDGSIDTAHIGDLQVSRAKIAADAIDGTKLADNAVDSEHYTDGSIDTAHIGDSQVTTAKIADSAVTNAKLADAELQELATMGGLTAAALADLTQAEVQILDGATVTTAELNKIDGLTADASDLNQLDTNTLTNSPTWTSTSQYPSAASIDSRITARIDPLGGFEAIADEDSFPATAPPEGTVVSIANANGLAVNASGVGAGTRAGGSDAVVINGFPSGFNSTSLDDGIGLLVVATSTAHTYDFHRVVAKNEDVRQLSSDINDFKARYRVGSSNPTTDNDPGDLFFNTGTDKMLVRNAANDAWDEVQSIGEFFINTLSSSSGTGGGSATFNGTAYRFTLSNAPTNAQQLIVSINGVVQKPNSGTTQPSEGFAIDGADIIFGAAPASGSDFFIVTIGSSVNIGTPSAGTVDTTQLADGAVTNAKVDASAAIAGTKISPDFGSQNVVTTGSLGVGTTSPGAKLEISANNNGATQNNVLRFTDTDGSFSAGQSPGRIEFNTSDADSPGTTAFIDTYGYTNAVSDLLFGTGAGGSATERMRIKHDGKVGIGTTSPNLNTLGTAVHVSNAASGNAAITRYTTGDTGTAATDGLDVGMWSDGDAFFWLREASNIRFATSSTERVRIDSSGNVGIGTTTPDARLEVSTGGGTEARITSTIDNNADLTFYTNGVQRGIVEGNSTGMLVGTTGALPTTLITNNLTRATIDSSGRVLIGSSSARTPGSGSGIDFQVEGAPGPCNIGAIRNSNNAFPARVLLAKTRGGSVGSNTSVQSGDQLGLIEFDGADGTGLIQSASIEAFVDGTPGTNDMPGRLVFSTTADGASSPTERMRIKSSGNVSINLPSNTTSRHIGITNIAGTIGWTLGNGVTSSTRQFVVYDNEAGAARTVIDSSGNFKFNSGYGSAATAYGVRAWVNFNGTGTVSIREDGNVSSITDNGTGDYRINFSTAMPDTNYTALSGGTTTADSSICVLHFNPWNGSSPQAPNTSWIEVENRESTAGALKDVDYGYVAIVR